MKRTWTKEEKKILLEEAGKIPLELICEKLKRSRTSVYLFCYRNSIPIKDHLEKNVIREMFRIRFGSENFFKPNREFYKNADISQKRFQKIFLGYTHPSLDEVSRIAKTINLATNEALKLLSYMQLNLFPDDTTRND